ncbi:MAG: DUF7689 domain-containing protein [Terriglobia bacterium]
MEFTLSTSPDFFHCFPNLKPHCCIDGVSPSTPSYNCIAWAASVTTEWWEPDPGLQYYWPENVPREYTIDAYVAAFRTRGFEICGDDLLEPEIEKIAIYILQGFPAHAARQLTSGNWTSKMGAREDIEHIKLESVGGPLYGNASIHMKRNTKPRSS